MQYVQKQGPPTRQPSEPPGGRANDRLGDCLIDLSLSPDARMMDEKGPGRNRGPMLQI
jgi:hypothetical protein